MKRELSLSALAVTVTATAAALATDPKNPKTPKSQTVTVATAPAPQVAVVAPAPAVVPIEVEPPDRPGFSAAGLIGLSSDGFGFGLGARAGYTLPFHLYLGGVIADYFGGGNSVFVVGPEVGYDLALPAGGLPFLLRPYVGFGYAGLGGSTLIGAGHVFTVFPGAEILYAFVPNFFAGIDFRVPIFTGGEATAIFIGSLTAGYKM
jgi:hypothetical protein